MENPLKPIIHSFDERRNIFIAPDKEAAVEYAVSHWITAAQSAIEKRGAFFAALSGGSTPNAIFALLAKKSAKAIDWNKVHLFWSDERSVPPDNSESNYKMAMDAGIQSLPIPSTQIHRMVAEKGVSGAEEYERLLLKTLPQGIFDLVMLGMGNDGHTASLFPHTSALHENRTLVVRNFVPSKNTWRMTLTFPCINHARETVLYVLGKDKAEMVLKVFKGPYMPDEFPVQRIGTAAHKALWIMDKPAAAALLDISETSC